MAATLNVLFAAVLLSFISQGYGQCSLANLKINQSKTDAQVQGKPVWLVTISVNCLCSVSDLKLNCDGFQSVTRVDPSILAQSGSECLVNNGLPIFKSKDISFTYAADAQFPFNPISSQINCS